MNKKELVRKELEDMDLKTVTIEGETTAVELPALEAQLILEAFVNKVMEDVKKEWRVKATKTNATSKILQENSLLNEREEEEVLASNIEASGKATAFEEFGSLLYENLNNIIDMREG